jgi:hypothetical protein
MPVFELLIGRKRPSSIQHHRLHRARGLNLASSFLNFGNDTIDTGRHCLKLGTWKERAKFSDEIPAHPCELRVDLPIGLMSKRERNIVGRGNGLTRMTLNFWRYSSPKWTES